MLFLAAGTCTANKYGAERKIAHFVRRYRALGDARLNFLSSTVVRAQSTIQNHCNRTGRETENGKGREETARRNGAARNGTAKDAASSPRVFK